MVRRRAYRFSLDAAGRPIELGSGRTGKVFLGEEHWLESKTAFTRKVAIKILQRNVAPDDALRFQMEKELLERVQGHPDVITLYASGESDAELFVPPALQAAVEQDYMILELCDMSLEERLKGRAVGSARTCWPTASATACSGCSRHAAGCAAVEYTHLGATCPPRHQARKHPAAPARPRAAGLDPGRAPRRLQRRQGPRRGPGAVGHPVSGVPGTLFFQSPEQETNMFELLVNVEHGSPEVTYFEDFYIAIAQNDTFELFNRAPRYLMRSADLASKRL